jgi:Ni/Co efflux regulator RcnB
MKRTLLAATAAALLLAPFTALAAPPYGERQPQTQVQTQIGDRNNDARRDDARRDDGRRYSDSRHKWRDRRTESRWNESQHNGYYDNGRWAYGPPPSDRYGRPGFALGYHPWSRGQRLGYYNGRYQEVDYRSHRLRRPQRGYHWVQDDRGDYLLAALAGGLIAQVVLNNGR